MSEELNCMNCSIGDFKHDLCDCDNGFCKEFKSIGKQEDFFNAVMQRIRPKGKWVEVTNGRGGHECSECHDYAPSFQNGAERLSHFCPSCGADMRGAENGTDKDKSNQ